MSTHGQKSKTLSSDIVVTICTITLNREWIISHMLSSLLSQKFPKDKIFFVLVDGGSTDNTVKVAEEILKNSGIKFKIIVQPSNIGEARNICTSNIEGDVLVFWDSDVVAPSNALQVLLEHLYRFDVHILGLERSILKFDNLEKLQEAVQIILSHNVVLQHTDLVEVDVIGMDFTAIRREVLKTTTFRPLPYAEDADFCIRAKLKGYKIALLRGVMVYDIKIPTLSHADPFLYARLFDQIKYLKDLALLDAIRTGPEGRWIRERLTLKEIFKILVYEKYHLIVKLGMLFSMVLGFTGIVLNNLFLALVFIIFPLYLAYWALKIGLRNGLLRLISTLLVGIPMAITELYYLISLWAKRFKK